MASAAMTGAIAGAVIGYDHRHGFIGARVEDHLQLHAAQLEAPS